MYCENCGALIPDSAKFCPECGKAQSPGLKAEPETLRCPYCGKELEPDSVFCENCGKKLNVKDVRSDQIPSVSARPQSYTVPPVPPVQEKTYVPSTPPVPPVPPAPSSAPVQTYGTAIPAPPPAAVRGTAPEKKKRSGCCLAVLIVLILLILLGLAAGYYFWKVYEGDNQIKSLISGFMPTVEMILTKAPEAISDVESVLTKVPETVSGLIIKPTDTAASVFQTTAPSVPSIPPTATTSVSLWDSVPSALTDTPATSISILNMPTSQPARRGYDPGYYSTTEMSRLQDFLWLTQDIVHGSLPAGIDRLTTFDELLGGWKAYIIDDLNGQYGSGIERLCTVNFSKDANGNGMTFNWSYVHNTKTDEGNTDFTPPTTFYGEMQNGRFYGLGTGSIDLTAFYELEDHEYAVGQLHWPDASIGTVFLVRP